MKTRLILVVGVLMSLLMASNSLVAAKTAPDVDAIAEAVEAADIPALVAGLEDPIRTKDLPTDFTDATFVDITSASDVKSAGCVYDASSLSDLQGAAAYDLTVDPEAGDFTKACGSINYLVYTKKDLGKDPLGDYKNGILSSLTAEPGTPDANGGISTLEDTTVAGADAVLFTYSIESASRAATVQILAVVVGNVIVLTQLQTQGTSLIPGDVLAPISSDLMEAAIDHLGTVAADAAA
ncbi:MAG: hypothetical protein QM753_05610 [Thermomicrobiales bacterium]